MNLSWSTISKVSSCLGAIVLMSPQAGPAVSGTGSRGGGGGGGAQALHE